MHIPRNLGSPSAYKNVVEGSTDSSPIKSRNVDRVGGTD